MTSAAASDPSCAHSASGRPVVRPCRNPAAYRSPAPVVSTSCSTVAAGTSTVSSAVTTIEPCSERVITTISDRPRTAETACERSRVVVSARISSSLANSTSTSFSTSARNSSRWRSTQNESDSVSDTRRPAPCAAAIATRNASLARGLSQR